MALDDTWMFARNFIYNACHDNFTKSVKVSTYHFDTLTAGSLTDPEIAAMLVEFTPVHNGLMNASSTKGVNVGERVGMTDTLKDLFQDMTDTHLPAWQQAIGNTYIRKSPQFKALFPRGAAPFEQGTIDNRILAVKTLKEACEKDTLLAAVAVTVNDFLKDLNDARTAQGGLKGTVGSNIGTQKSAIKNMSVVHFQNHGKLISKYPEDADKIESFTDVTALQDHKHDNTYAVTINPAKTKKVLTHKFTPASKITFANTGTTMLQVWIIDKANNKVHPTGVNIIPGAVQTINITDLGNAAHRILMVQNLSPTTDGSCEVTV